MTGEKLRPGQGGTLALRERTIKLDSPSASGAGTEPNQGDADQKKCALLLPTLKERKLPGELLDDPTAGSRLERAPCMVWDSRAFRGERGGVDRSHALRARVVCGLGATRTGLAVPTWLGERIALPLAREGWLGCCSGPRFQPTRRDRGRLKELMETTRRSTG